MDGFTIELWTLAVAMYEENDHSGIPLHKRSLPVRDAWRNAARKKLAGWKVAA